MTLKPGLGAYYSIWPRNRSDMLYSSRHHLICHSNEHILHVNGLQSNSVYVCCSFQWSLKWCQTGFLSVKYNYHNYYWMPYLDTWQMARMSSGPPSPTYKLVVECHTVCAYWRDAMVLDDYALMPMKKWPTTQFMTTMTQLEAFSCCLKDVIVVNNPRVATKLLSTASNAQYN